MLSPSRGHSVEEAALIAAARAVVASRRSDGTSGRTKPVLAACSTILLELGELEEGGTNVEAAPAAVGAPDLPDAERALEALVASLPDVVVRFDPELKQLYLSPATERATSDSSPHLVGTANLEAGMSADLVRDWDVALRRVLATGQPETLELTFAAPEGARHFDCHLVPERDGDGVVRSVLSVARDVTDRWLAHDLQVRARATADALREATLELTRSHDRGTVLATLLDRLRHMVPCDRARVLLLDEAARLTVRAIFDGSQVVPFPPEGCPAFDASDHAIVQSILASGTPVLIPDIRTRPDWSLPADSRWETSWMGVPLFARGTVAGLVSLSKKEPDYFREEHVRLAEAMSTQASVAVENAVLFEQMQASSLRMQSLSRRLVEIQEDERRHIARELHDEAGQALISLRYGLRLLEKEIEVDALVTKRIHELVATTDDVIDGLRRLAADLRPASLDHLGLEAALRQFTRSASEKFGLKVRFKARGFTGERLPTAVETGLFRAVQEAMTNVVRHAHATEVDVFAEHRGERIMVMIEDDGVGFDTSKPIEGNHFGLLGLRERADALGGTLTVESTPGAGTTIVMEVASANPHSDR